MSLSHQFDEYLAARGIEPSAEVIPELPCHEYDHTATPNGGDADRQAIAAAEDGRAGAPVTQAYFWLGMVSGAMPVLPVLRSPIMSWRWPRPMGIMESMALSPV